MAKIFFTFLLLISTATGWAGSVGVPNTFTPNTPALASEVNANFQALVDAVNAQQAAISQLQSDLNAAQTTIDQLQTDLSAAQAEIASNNTAIVNIQGNSVLALDGFLFMDTDINGFATARFDAINVQVTNGLGATNGLPEGDPALSGPVNGLGNLIVGYNEEHPAAVVACSNGAFDNQADCETNGWVWAANQRTGSHSLVIGVGHSYTAHGHLLAGFGNFTSSRWATVSGGANNLARGVDSSISGGLLNIAIALQSSVSGGLQNIASGSRSSISGGRQNAASGFASNVAGGFGNDASGDQSSISGGRENAAIGARSTVTGGYLNDATGINSSVSGGLGNEASGDQGSVSGGQLNIASGITSSVSGGLENIAGGNTSSVSGGRLRSVSGSNDWRAGTLFEDI